MRKNKFIVMMLFLTCIFMIVSNRQVQAETAYNITNPQSILLDQTYTGNVTLKAEDNWYVFKTGAGYKDYCLSFVTEGRVYWKVYDANKELVPNASGSGDNFDSYVELQSNQTYYLYIKRCFTDSTYTFAVKTRDDVADDAKAATSINCNILYNGNISNDLDVDWYKFVAPATGTYKIIVPKQPNTSIDLRGFMSDDGSKSWLWRENYHLIEDKDIESEAISLEKGKVYYLMFSVFGDADNSSFTFKILAPAKEQGLSKTSFKSVKGASKKVALTWKKVSGATEYQIRYATTKSMKKAKSVTVKGTKKTITKLKGNKRYYFQIRSRNGKESSAWSSVKSVKTKK